MKDTGSTPALIHRNLTNKIVRDNSKSNFFKLRAIHWLGYAKGCRMAFTEYINNCDVLGINRANYKIEVEIKTSKPDLVKELKCIQRVIGRIGETWYCDKSYKCHKHQSYLIQERDYNPRPRKFYFAVPQSLWKTAMEGVEGTPYGVIIIDKYGTVSEIVEAKPIQSAKFDKWESAALKASAENLSLRDKLNSLTSS